MADLAVLMLSFVATVRVLAWLTEPAVAAYGLGVRVQSLLLVPLLALSRAVAALAGNALGHDDADEARGVLRAALAVGLLAVGPLALAVVAWPTELLTLLGVGAESPVHAPALAWLRVLAWTTPALGVHLAFTGLFRGAGATGTSLAINVAGTFAVQIPAAIGLGLYAGLGPLGVWLSLPLAVATRLALDVAAYRGARWATPDA